jgi:hypothetical protein
VRGDPVRLRFATGQCTEEALAELRGILERHAGHVPVRLELLGDDGPLPFQLGDHLRVSRRPGLFGELKSRFGPDSVSDGVSTG